MKLSLKLQDDQNSVIRAKLPISIFTHPFMSTLTTTTTTVDDSKKFSSNPSFSLSTNFPSGPSLRVSYTPSSSTTSSPFSVSLKSGLGLFGSPKNSPLIFSAHFSLSPTNPVTLVPTFSLHFKPQSGNFSLHQVSSSNPSFEPDYGTNSGSANRLQTRPLSNSGFENEFASEGSSVWQEVKLEPSNCGGDGLANPSMASAPERSLVRKNGNKYGIFSGIGVNARTLLPVTKRFAVNMRWGIHFPTDSWNKMPYLTMNKIGLERVEEVNKKNKSVESNAGDLELLKGLCFRMRRDFEVLEKENKEMKQLMEEMRQRGWPRNLHVENEGNKKMVSQAKAENSVEFERSRGKRSGGEDNGGREMKRSPNKMTDVESELQKAIKAASA